MRTLFILMMAMSIGSCAPQSDSGRLSPFDPYSQTIIDSQMMPVDDTAQNQNLNQSQTVAPANGKVALLLPLSGQHAAIGQSMLNAAQLAVFDVNDPSFELIPIDTKGTARGASAAIEKAARHNVKLVLGPLLSSSVQSAGQAAQRYNLNIIGFTTDATILGGNIFTLGILPNDQGKRLAAHLNQTNLRRVAILTPFAPYANAVASAFEGQARQNNIQIVTKIKISSANDMVSSMQKLRALRGQFDAILMPVGNPTMARLSNALNAEGLGAQTIPWIGTGLWDSPAIQQNRLMIGATYSAPPPQMRASFDRQYRATFTNAPQRLASLAYDATALSTILLRQNPTGVVSKSSILNPNGFAGVDGVFRFHTDGRAERGLAMHRITGMGLTSIITPAPRNFLQ
jgi:branched-chain amino acid transport system substrate-binding protein